MWHINLIEGKGLARTFGDSCVEDDVSSKYSVIVQVVQ
jgi:hypothetical protein